MDKYIISVIVGSLSNNSLNQKLANAIIKLAPPEFTFKFANIRDLPLYNPDDDNNPTDLVTNLKNEISSSDGLLFVTPEYNRSIPGALKNFLDTCSRPYGKNSFAGKPAGIIGASVGAIGTALAQQHLRNILAYLDVPTLCQPEAFIHVKEDFFEANGDISPKSKDFIEIWVTKYVEWVKNITSLEKY